MTFFRWLALSTAALCIHSAAAAQSTPAGAFSFLRLEPSARASALAGSFSAVYGEDVNALFYNPALLNENMHRALSVSYLNHLAGINAGFVAYSSHIEKLGTFGAGLRFVSWGDMNGYDEMGEETGGIGVSDAALTVSYARSDDARLRYGASIHAILSKVGSYGASAIAGDVGMAYHLPESRLTVSASANNVGFVLNSLGSKGDELPLDLRVGVSKRLDYVPLFLTVTGYDLNRIGENSSSGSTIGDAMRHVAIGGEFQFSEAFNLRLGYNHRKHEELKMKSRLDMAGFGIGFGIKVARIRFDYAFNSWSSLGGLHQFTLRTVI